MGCLFSRKRICCRSVGSPVGGSTAPRPPAPRDREPRTLPPQRGPAAGTTRPAPATGAQARQVLPRTRLRPPAGLAGCGGLHCTPAGRPRSRACAPPSRTTRARATPPRFLTRRRPSRAPRGRARRRGRPVRVMRVAEMRARGPAEGPAPLGGPAAETADGVRKLPGCPGTQIQSGSATGFEMA